MLFQKEEVLTTAKLAHLTISPEELSRYAEHLSAIVEYVGKLSAAPVEEEINALATPALSLRPDEVLQNPEESQRAVALFPESEAGLLSVPQVFEDREASLEQL